MGYGDEGRAADCYGGPLGQRLAGPESKYVWLCGWDGPCHHNSTDLL